MFTGSNRSLFSDLQGFYRVKSVSLFRFTRSLQGQISLPFSIYSVITWSNRSPFLIYKVFTGSNRSLFSDLQGFYRVKSVSFSIYSVITWSNRSPFLIHKVFTGSNRSLFFDLQGFYRVKSVSLFRFTWFLQGQMRLPFSVYNVIIGSNWSLSIYKVFTESNQSPFFELQCYYRVKSVSLS